MMAATKVHSVISGKVMILLATAAMAVLFFSTIGYAQESPSSSPSPSPPDYKYPPCETLGVTLPECQAWCDKVGFHGGYLKADVCCCMN